MSCFEGDLERDGGWEHTLRAKKAIELCKIWLFYPHSSKRDLVNQSPSFIGITYFIFFKAQSPQQRKSITIKLPSPLTALKDLRSADLFEQQVHNQETKATHLASLRLCSSVALHVNFESPMSKFQKLSIKHEH